MIFTNKVFDYYSKANSHDKEVQRLYEEMEQQIRTEKERVYNEVNFPIVMLPLWKDTWKKSENKELKLFEITKNNLMRIGRK